MRGDKSGKEISDMHIKCEHFDLCGKIATHQVMMPSFVQSLNGSRTKREKHYFCDIHAKMFEEVED